MVEMDRMVEEIRSGKSGLSQEDQSAIVETPLWRLAEKIRMSETGDQRDEDNNG